jgi:hypothetical protein
VIEEAVVDVFVVLFMGMDGWMLGEGLIRERNSALVRAFSCFLFRWFLVCC